MEYNRIKEEARINEMIVEKANKAATGAYDDVEETIVNHMQFLRFAEDGDGIKVDLCWAC